jgi:tRNA(Ile)-lysidine synthase
MGGQDGRNAHARGDRLGAARGVAAAGTPRRRSDVGAALVLGRLRAAARELDLAGRRILVAVSGGVDSTVLLHGLHALREPLGLELRVGHVHHGLRGAEADADAEAVRALAERLALPVAWERVAPRALREGVASRVRPTLQEAARRLRYDALRRLAAEAGAERIATAHNADDQAETVLLRLLRGSGPDGLCGIPRRAGDGLVVRPLLALRRRDVLAYARSRGLTWREDSSNAETHYARNRLRRVWLPGLARDFNPQLLRSLARLAEAQQQDREWIEALVASEAARRFELRDGVLHLRTDGWSDTPDALARRLVRHALAQMGAGREVTRVHIDRMLHFLRAAPRRGSGRRVLELPIGLRLVREAGEGGGYTLHQIRVEPQPAC